jgi:hypothetical protein
MSFAKSSFVSILFFVLTQSNVASAFVLISPTYKLANPADTVVNVASGTCGTNIPESVLLNAIDIAINQFWNTVTESKLRLRLGGVVAKTTLAEVSPGEILVGCNTDAGNGGFANIDDNNGTGIVTLEKDILAVGFDRLVWVVAHEIGHTLGLTHSGDPASVMTYDDHAWGPRPEHLAQDDKNGIVYLYPIDGQAGGLIPGCSVKASSGSRSPQEIWISFLQELAGVLVAVGVYKIWMRARRRLNS